MMMMTGSPLLLAQRSRKGNIASLVTLVQDRNLLEVLLLGSYSKRRAFEGGGKHREPRAFKSSRSQQEMHCPLCDRPRASILPL